MTPLMQQYWDIKSVHADKILLFRMGDFFEMFFQDAVQAAPVLGIALTQRNKKSQDETPMCGVPYHSIAGPINKLLAQGFKVAICDQVEDPKLSKGLVKRAVTRVLTPGMVYDPETLEGTESHYMMSFDSEAASFVDPTTGECFFLERHNRPLREFLSFPLAEVVISSFEHLSDLDSQDLEAWKKNTHKTVSEYSNLDFSQQESSVPAIMAPKYSETESVEPKSSVPTSAQRLLAYIHSLCLDNQIQLRPFQKRSWQSRLNLSPATFRHLEIFENSFGEKTGTFFEAINRTKTSGGARLLREFLRFPLVDEKEIVLRQRQIASWISDLPRLEEQRRQLSFLGDIERRLMKISQPTVNPRDLLALAEGLEIATRLLDKVDQDSRSLDQLSAEIQKTIIPEPPVALKAGGFIQKGVSAVLDDLIELTTNSQFHLQQLEERERARTQIGSLKIRYNNVFGYYIEVTHTHKDKVPADYQRKQTLANAERFCTEELLQLERKILSAQSRKIEVEQALFDDLKKKILFQSQLILKCAQECNERDVMTALAWLALEQNYVCPDFCSSKVGLPLAIDLELSRHPVVEQTLKIPFVANNIRLNQNGGWILTGPNMAGKSTLMRQVALTVLLAQIGSFVPAKKARLPIFKQIFTRIGASDHLSQGLSTFMVEMKETAEVLTGAGPESLVILDEIGRGTSTYDGMSLAQAILEFLIKKSNSYILFATHYHELTSLAEKFSQIQNFHMSIQEVPGREGIVIRFLHTLAPGPAQKSYGIHVAEIAGLPGAVLKRARELLKKNESRKANLGDSLQDSQLASDEAYGSAQLSLLEATFQNQSFYQQNLHQQESLQPVPHVPSRHEEFLNQLKDLSVNETTPMQALNLLVELKSKAQELLN